MFAAIAFIAEQRIREAQQLGEFDNLPGRGRPLQLEDDSNVPDDLKMAYKLLKNAGYVPEDSSAETIHSTRDLLPQQSPERRRLRQMQKMEIILSKAGLNEKRLANLEASVEYFDSVVSRVPLHKRKESV